MPKRREKGEGSVYQRASDNMYVAYCRLENGRKKYLYAKTRKEVVAKLKELQTSIEQKTYLAAKPETVQEYLTYWLSIHRTQIKESTYHSYVSQLKAAYPHIGNVKLQKLKADNLQHMYAELQDGTRGNERIKILHAILNTAFKDAIKWQRLAFNPCSAVEPPKVTKQEHVVLTLEQCQHLLSVAAETPLACFISLALGLGLRYGELLALKWEDIDLEEKYLRIKRTLVCIPDENGKYQYIETPPKSKTSNRPLLLPQFVLDALKTHKVKQIATRLAAAEWEDKGYVLTNPKGGHVQFGTSRNQFKKLLEQAGMPDMRVHDLRHSSATCLLGMGIPAIVVQAILGHSSIVITQNIYGHVLPQMQAEAMEKMDRLFKQN